MLKKINYYKNILLDKSNDTPFLYSLAILFSLIIILRFCLGSIGDINWDYPIFFDGMWRVYNGQIPHLDFSTPIGPVTFWIGSLGAIIFGLSINSFDYGLILLSIILIPIFIYFSRQYFSTKLVFAFSLLILSFLITPRIIGYPSYYLAYTSNYNFIGYCLVFLTVLFFLKEEKANQKSHIAFFLAGFFTIVSFFTKITFGVGLIIFGILSLYLKNTDFKLVKTYFYGLFFTLILFLFYFNFEILDLFSEYKLVLSSSNDQTFYSLILNKINFFFLNSFNFFFAFFPIVISFYFIFIIYKEKSSSEKNSILFKQLFLFMFLGLALMFTVNQPPEFIAGTFIIIIFLDWLEVNRNLFLSKFTSLFKYTGYLIIYSFILNNLFAIPAGFYKKVYLKNNYSAQFNDYTNLKDGYFNINSRITDEYIDGFNILSNFIKKDDKISVIGVNIFSFGLAQKSPRNDLLYWHEGVTFSKNSIPNLIPEVIFQETTILMVPKTMIHRPDNAIKHFYPFINDNFDLIVESTYWKVYSRNFF
tara:strand:+ start:4083 stop:5675 length:1593 start_codon:yes stop_codon:yes gene_type:complete